MSDLSRDVETAGGPPPPSLAMEALPSFAGPARGRPFVLAGDRAAVVGHDRSGAREIFLHPVRAFCGLRTGLPEARRARIALGAARRLLDGGGVRVTESLLVFRRLPGAVLRWSRPAGGQDEQALDLVLAWRCPEALPRSGARHSPDDDTLRLALDDRPGKLVLALRGGPGRWRLRPDPSGSGIRVELRAALQPGGTLALVAALAREDGPSSAVPVLARLPRLGDEVRGWAADARRAREDLLSLDADDEGTGSALAWAVRRLPGSVVHPEGRRPGRVVEGYGSPRPAGQDEASDAPRHRDVPPSAPLGQLPWIGHGLLAAGLHREAGEVAAAGLDRLDRGSVSSEDRGTGDAALVLNLAARHALWTGDGSLLRERRTAVDGILEDVEAAVAGEVAAALLVAAAAACRDLADAVEAGGRPERAAGIRNLGESAASRLASSGPSSPSHGSLPGAGVLAAVLGVAGPDLEAPAPDATPGGQGSSPGERAGTVLRAWAAWSRGDPDGALRAWRTLLLSGTSDGTPGLWGSPEAGPGTSGSAGGEAPAMPTFAWHSSTTALVVAPVVFGLLGARADAAYGRLRLSPRVPAAWDRFRVGGLRVGDGTVRIDYRREAGRHTFVLSPTAGRVPLNVAFEPILPEREPGTVRVGGEKADVERFRHGERAGIRLQLPLDAIREITVDGAERGS